MRGVSKDEGNSFEQSVTLRNPGSSKRHRVIFPLGSYLRLARAGFVLARAGVFRDVDPSVLPAPARLPLAIAKFVARRDKGPSLSRLPDAISELGPSYVKLGQFLATRPDVVGPAVVLALERLQDRMAAFPKSVAIATIEAAFDQNDRSALR